jgi:hypothetical protein
MSFQLHPNCKERLSVVIAEVLSGIIVQHHVLPTSLEMRDFGQCEKVMPQAQREALESYIGDTPLTTFVDSWLIRKLRNTLDYSAEPQPSMLTDLPGFEDSHAVAKCLVDDLSTLPWQYVFTIPLPGEIGRIWAKAKNPFKIAEHIIIRTPDDTFGEDFPFSGWGNSSPYLRVLGRRSPTNILGRLYRRIWYLGNLGGRLRYLKGNLRNGHGTPAIPKTVQRVGTKENI